MNMKSKSINTNYDELDSILQSALEFDSDEEKLQFEAEMLHLNTMSLIEKLMKNHNMNKKDLAKKLNISQSFITQLFTADKFINYKLLAKLQRIFNINFTIDVKSNIESNNYDNELVIAEFNKKINPKIISLLDYHKNNDEVEYSLKKVSTK